MKIQEKKTNLFHLYKREKTKRRIEEEKENIFFLQKYKFYKTKTSLKTKIRLRKFYIARCIEKHNTQ